MTELEHVIVNSPRLRPRTKVVYLECVQAFIEFAGDNPASWTGPMVESWRDTLAKERKPQTVNLYLSAVRYAARRIAARHQNPALDFARYAEMLPETGRRPPRVLTLEEGRRLLRACRGPRPIDRRDLALCTLGLRTGLRRQGMAGIQIEDLRPPVISVTLKGGRRHDIVADGEVWKAFESWGRWLRQHGITSGPLFRGLAAERVDGTTPIRSGLSPGGLYAAVKARAKKADIEGMHPHVFRHTFVSWCRTAGVADWRIADVTGHTVGRDIAPMLRRYTHDLDRESNPVGNAIPGLLDPDDDDD